MDLGERKRTVASTYIQLVLIFCGIYGYWRTLVNMELAEGESAIYVVNILK